jgi:hypothetical protein
MAIVQAPYQPGASEKIGQGISDALQMLAQHKLQQFQQKQNITALQSTFPQMSKEEVAGLGKMSPEFAKSILPQLINQQLKQRTNCFKEYSKLEI